MKTITITLTSMLALASALPVHATTSIQDAGQDAVREAVTPYPDQLSPRLHAALLRVLEAEEEFTLLTHPFDEHGNMIGQDEQEWRMTSPESPLKQYLDRHTPRFDARGLGMDRHGLRDCILYDAGFTAAAELIAEHPDFSADELLAAFDRELVEGLPVWPTELAREHHARFLAGHEFWPLGNGRALGRLTWGLLQQDAWWRAEGNDRGELILGLFDRGLQSRHVAQVVDLSLANALPASLDPTRDGRGICPPDLSIAMDIGYDQRHEAALVSDLELITYLSTIQDPSGAFDMDLVAIEELESGQVEITPTAMGHLRWWVPARLDAVRLELYDGEYLEAIQMEMRRSTSLEERLMFWDKLAERTDFVTLRTHVLEELAGLLAWQVDFPGTERLQELMALADAGSLSSEQLAELETLKYGATRDQDLFIGMLFGKLVDSGVEHDMGLLVSTLADSLPMALEQVGQEDFTGGMRQDALLNGAWLQLACTKSPELNRLLADELSEPQGLPALARDNLIWAATQDQGSQAEGNLERVLEIGSPRDKAIALLNPSWAPEQTYTTAMKDLLDQVYSEKVGYMTRLRIESYFTSSLEQRPASPGTREILLASLADKNWASKSKDCYWSQAWESPDRFSDRLALVRKSLSPQEIEAKVAEGLIPPDIF